jgi:hypothetical protein
MLKTIGGQEEMVELGGAERLVDFADALVDDPVHITKYRAMRYWLSNKLGVSRGAQRVRLTGLGRRRKLSRRSEGDEES